MTEKPVGPARRPHRGNVRNEAAHQEILRAAGDILDEVGYTKLTIEAVAARAKVSKATVYRWWSSKAVLVMEVCANRYRAEVPDTGDSRQDLMAYLRVNVIQQERDVDPATGLAMAADVANTPEAQHLRDEIVANRRSLGRTVVARVIERGDLPPDTDIDFVLDMFAGFTFYRHNFTDRPIGVEYTEQLVDLLLRGHVPRGPGPEASDPSI